MDEMPSMRSIGETVEDYFMKAMLEQLKKPTPFILPNATIRNEAYYAKQKEPPVHCCGECGRPYDGDEYDGFGY